MRRLVIVRRAVLRRSSAHAIKNGVHLPFMNDTRIYESYCVDWQIIDPRVAHFAMMELERVVFALKNVELVYVFSARLNETTFRTFAEISFDAN